MDTVKWKENAAAFFSQYKYVILVVMLGLFLMLLPGNKEQPAVVSDSSAQAQLPNPQEELEQILALIEGVGKVKVLLTISQGEQTIYEYDEDRTDSVDSASIRRDAVIITDTERTEHGLIQQIIPPIYLGAVVVCQGGDRPSVRLQVVEAVANATGLSTDRITVLKMK